MNSAAEQFEHDRLADGDPWGVELILSTERAHDIEVPGEASDPT